MEQFFFLQWQNGERVIIFPEELAEADPWYPLLPWSERSQYYGE